LDDRLGRTVHEESNFDLATNSDVAQGCTSSSGVELNKRGLCVRVSEPHSEEISLLFALNENKWMDTIDLFASCAIIIRAVGSSSPHCPGTFT